MPAIQSKQFKDAVVAIITAKDPDDPLGLGLLISDRMLVGVRALEDGRFSVWESDDHSNQIDAEEIYADPELAAARFIEVLGGAHVARTTEP